MALYINTNTNAMTAENNLDTTEAALNTATEDLSSGLRINTAADDAAGYSIVEDLTAQSEGLSQAESNTQDAVSLVQTADGALNSVEEILQRIRELAVEYSGGTLSSADQGAIVSEINQLASEIDDISAQSQFNGITLFDGEALTFQVGANDGNTISITLSSLTGSTGIISGVDTVAGDLTSSSVLSTINSMIDDVSTQASELGAVQNRLSYTLDNLESYSENLSSASSTIQDVDIASEMTTYTQESVLEQSGISVLAQAEQQPQQVLKLIEDGMQS